ncbi:hypothetical protein [Maribacter stanieri]|uniref:hypothetical protein n=1 Tax=Maribacter stanieri TaxID=440514 RepID=UPI0030DBABAA
MNIKLSLLLLTISFLCSCSNNDDQNENNSKCFSPTQNLSNAYEPGSVGCDCDSENDANICVQDEKGSNVALICSEKKWIVVEDGPCNPGKS